MEKKASETEHWSVEKEFWKKWKAKQYLQGETSLLLVRPNEAPL